MYPITNINGLVDAAVDWGLDPKLLYPIKIICVPAMCTLDGHFAYQQIDFADYDLVVISDIEYFRQNQLHQWIQQNNIKNYVLAVGGMHPETVLLPNEVYRPWWSFNLLKFNQLECRAAEPRFDFDCLLGARRPHRDFAMLAMQETGIINSSIVTYRDFFHGDLVDHQSQEFAGMFPNQKLNFPYVSPNLDPEWEVDRPLNRSISPFVPWNIYHQCRYSIVCETLGTGDCFFLSEKTAKALFAGRVFLMFGNCNFLANLQKLGFKTFSDIIDESYDSNPLDFERFAAVRDQMEWLSKQDYSQVMSCLEPILVHNQNRLAELQQEKRHEMQRLLDHKLNSLRIR
jgi:hypothetical protein